MLSKKTYSGQKFNWKYIMTAILSYLLSMIRGSHSHFRHAFNLPFPKVMHKVIQDETLAKYSEVFVIGDVHGCFDELAQLLEKAEVKNDNCLKIFVGDLVNKGPDSHKVVEMMRNSSSMLSVRGNHDEVVLREYRDSSNPDYKLDKQNLWIKDLPQEDIDYLNDLPYSISIPALKAIIVHAGLVPGRPLERNTPMDLVTMRNIVSEEGGMKGIKEVDKGDPWAMIWKGPEHVYFGHDAKRMLQLYPHATGLDTGCVYGNWLTGLFIKGQRKGTFVKVNALKTHRKTKNEQ